MTILWLTLWYSCKIYYFLVSYSNHIKYDSIKNKWIKIFFFSLQITGKKKALNCSQNLIFFCLDEEWWLEIASKAHTVSHKTFGNLGLYILSEFIWADPIIYFGLYQGFWIRHSPLNWRLKLVHHQELSRASV